MYYGDMYYGAVCAVTSRPSVVVTKTHVHGNMVVHALLTFVELEHAAQCVQAMCLHHVLTSCAYISP